MPSASLQQWQAGRATQLEEIEAAHRSIGGTTPGRRFATQQINHAYAMLLSSQFQGFCRDLHSESVDCIVGVLTPTVFQNAARQEFRLFRLLDRGNPTPGNIGADFGRMGIAFWPLVYADGQRNNRRREFLEEMNLWRNAIAHQDFDPAKLGGTATLHLATVRSWRRACDGLAKSFDRVMRSELNQITGTNPW